MWGTNDLKFDRFFFFIINQFTGVYISSLYFFWKHQFMNWRQILVFYVQLKDSLVFIRKIDVKYGYLDTLKHFSVPIQYNDLYRIDWTWIYTMNKCRIAKCTVPFWFQLWLLIKRMSDRFFQRIDCRFFFVFFAHHNTKA